MNIVWIVSGIALAGNAFALLVGYILGRYRKRYIEEFWYNHAQRLVKRLDDCRSTSDRLTTLEDACKAVCLECLGGTEQENRSRNCYNPNFPCNITPIRRLMEPVQRLDSEESAVMSDATVNQPMPQGQVDVFPELIKDIEARRDKGIETYGEPLKTNNGRKPLIDAYQEVLDLAVYLKQELMEREEAPNDTD